jgi:hypothetical protein
MDVRAPFRPWRDKYLSPSMRRPIGVKMVLCSYLWILTFSPSRLCRHPSIRSL